MISPSKTRTLNDDWYQPLFSKILQQTSTMTPVIMAFHSILLGATAPTQVLAI